MDPTAQEVHRAGDGTLEAQDGRRERGRPGLSSRAGSALLALTACRVGLTDGLIDALAHTRERRSGHEPGRVASDLAVMLADGGRCVSDLAALVGQPALFGEVASVSTARRVVLSVGERELVAIRAARARARARAWTAGASAERVISKAPGSPRAGSAATGVNTSGRTAR